MLSNHCLCYIHSRTKEICMVLMECVTLDYWRNKHIILTLYNVKIYITSSKKEPCWYVPISYSANRLGSFRRYWFIFFNLIGKLPLGNFLVSFISDTIYYYKWTIVYSIDYRLCEILIVRLLLYISHIWYILYLDYNIQL